MTDVIVSHHVEAPAAAAPTPGQKEYVDGRAIIGYQSMLDAYDVAITATSQTTNYEAVNVKSRLTYSGWRPSAGGSQYLTFTGSVGHAVDYLAIAGHNLATKAATIDLEYFDGTNWLSILSGHVPASDAPIMLLFAQKEALSYRLRVDVSGTDYPTIATVLLGPRLSLQRGIYVGHRPAPFSRDVQYLTEESEGGQIIGRSVLRRAATTDISLRRITPAWARAYLTAFLRDAEVNPFAFMWNTDDRYKGEIIYGRMENRPELVNDHQSFMACELSVRGLA